MFSENISTRRPNFHRILIEKSKKGGKDQEAIQSSTTLDPGYPEKRSKENASWTGISLMDTQPA